MISREIKELLDTIQNYKYPDYLVVQEHEPCIQVGEIVGRAARFYEKARYSVEYKEEHLLRRTAIERILRRRLTIEFTQEKSGHSFLVELIQAGYLPNDELPERAITYIQAVIDKTVFFISLLEHIYPSDQLSHFRSLVIKLATSEINDLLFPAIVNEATSKALYQKVKKYITISRSGKNKEDLDIQILLACRRGLLKDDDTISFYQLWLIYCPEWTMLNKATEKNDERLKEIAEEFDKVRAFIETQIKSSVHRRLTIKLKNDIIYFSLIRKIVSRYKEMSEDILNDPKQLQFAVQSLTEEEYQKINTRIIRSSWRAIIYILLTKTILALAIELPYDMIVYDEIHPTALILNIIFHPLLLFAMTTSIREPSTKNTLLIEQGVRSIVHDNKHKEIFLQLIKPKSTWQYVAGILYFTIFIFSFGVILWMLNKLQFNIIGIAFFLFFLTLISYFGLRIRFIARRLRIHADEQRFLVFVWDLVTLPILSLGRWLTLKFASINIFIFIMDFIIEAPFKIVLKALDTFALFVKEKKDEIY